MYYKIFRMVLVTFLYGCFLTGQSQTISKGLNPPANLVVDYELEDPNTYLTWWAPGTSLWLHYDTGDYATSIGLNEPGEFDVMVAYEPEQIKPFVGMGITKFAFTPSEVAVYVLKIWTGNTAETVVYEDTLTNLTIGDWNIVTLDSAVILEAGKVYFFGYHVNAEGGYPAGCDAGPTTIPGKSDLLRMSDGNFYSLNISFGIDLNWNVQVYLEAQSEKATPLAYQNQEMHISAKKSLELNSLVLKKNILKESIAFQPSFKVSVPTSYKVYRNNQMVGTSVEPSYHDVLPTGGVYTYAVSAIYDEGESDRSDSVTIIYDTNRIPVNKVIAEAFIHSDATQSPNSYGVYKGMFELEFEVDQVAPIIYHSGSSVFGEDPFSNTQSEERWMEYFMLYQGFPMAIFNGDLPIPGGNQEESMYLIYKEYYDYALTRLTPIGLNCLIEKVSSTKYAIHVNAVKVGHYLNDNFKLHVVLTRDSIAYNWYNGKFKEVSFVATGMYPNSTGTAFSFQGNNNVSKTVNFEIDPFEDIDNYRIVAFVQDNQTYQIMNGDILKLPQKRAVNFTVLDGGQPLENATIIVNESTLTTNNMGQAALNLFDNLGEVTFTVSKDKFETYTGVFNMDTASHITVNLIYNSIQDQQFSFRLFPNPVVNQLFIQTDQPIDASVCDVSGVKLIEVQGLLNQQPINLSHLESGIYIVKISHRGSNYSYRIVKQ